MAYLSYLFLRCTILLFSILPFRVLYLISDFLSFVLRDILKYRKDVALQNLTLVFPEKPSSEINKILRDSYRNLSDIIIESIKGFSLSISEINRRYHFPNREVMDNYYTDGKSVVGVVGHFANFEWGSTGVSQLKHQSIGIVKPLTNPYINAYIYRKRVKAGVIVENMKNTFKVVEENPERPTLLLLVADQTPSNPGSAIWTDFFGKDTAFLHGPETISRRFDNIIVFFDVRRKKRGFYEVYLDILLEDPRSLAEGEIIARYARRLEKRIRDQPSDWLWTHKRWKHKRNRNEAL
jgi:KDO2-lipid IV(A) lauroyltransferase